MKKYISILLVIVAILSVCACYDLDRYPEDKINTNTFWKTQQHAEQGINAIYAMFQNYYIFGSYFSPDTGNTAMRIFHAEPITVSIIAS